METVQIHTLSKNYPVFIGEKALQHLPEFISKHFHRKPKILIITDEHVGELYGDTLIRLLNIKGFTVYVHVVPAGEKAKSFREYEKCLSAGFENQLGRDSLILGFGGGVVGDLAGFVAATYMRGIPFIQIPTTLLAHDSAVGGKVAINHPLGKNLVGAFYQPDAVIYDTGLMASLPEREWRSGFAELIKHSLLSDEEFYRRLHSEFPTIKDLEKDNLSTFIKQGIMVKAEIVNKDEKEMGSRAFLNFGHTLAHAIEAAAGYGKITHGEAVAFGMVFDIYLSKKYCGMDFDLEEFKQWLGNLGYMKIPNNILEVEHLLEFMKRDKKNKQDHIMMVLLENIGLPKLKAFDEEEIRHDLKEFLQNDIQLGGTQC